MTRSVHFFGLIREKNRLTEEDPRRKGILGVNSLLLTRRNLLAVLLVSIAGVSWSSTLAISSGVIDDLSQPMPRASNGASWELIADRVMGGVSQGTVRREKVEGRTAIRMQGEVSLENNGGFLQIALDLNAQGSSVDASFWQGVEIDVLGNGEEYNLHLRTTDLRRPWQSYRQTFRAPPAWTTIKLSFADFTPYRIDAPLNLKNLRRIGIVAIGREFTADIAIGGVRYFK